MGFLEELQRRRQAHDTTVTPLTPATEPVVTPAAASMPTSTSAAPKPSAGPARNVTSLLDEFLRLSEQQPGNPLAEATLVRTLRDTTGWSQTRLADALGRSESYVSKKLKLVSAPDNVRARIASGDLSEKAFIEGRVHDQGAVVSRTRQARVGLTYEAALALARVCQQLAAQQGLAPIHLGKHPTRREVMAILEHRSEELAEVYKKTPHATAAESSR